MRFRIGDYVKVKGESGRIRYIGTTKFAAGTWFGVELERPVGKNNGSVQGVLYFQCQSSDGLHGVFVKEGLLETVADDVSESVIGSSSASDSLQHLQEQLNAVLAANTEYKDDLNKLQSELNAKLHSYEILESKLEMQLIDNQYLQEAKHLLETKVAEMTKKYQSLQKDYELVLEELEVSRELENELRFVDVDAVSPNEIKLLIERGRLDEKTIAKLNEKIQVRDENLSKLLKALMDSNSKVNDLGADLVSKTATIAHLKEKLETFSDLEELTEKLSVENGELIEKIKELERSIVELGQLHELDTKIEANLQKNEHNLRLEIESLKESLFKERNRVKDLESRVGSFGSSSNAKDSMKYNPREHLYALEVAQQKLFQLEHKYRQCALELQISESKRKFDVECQKLRASSPVSPEYIDLVYDIKSQCEVLNLLKKLSSHDESYLFYKFALSRILHFHQTILTILEYNYNHKLSEKLFKQSRVYVCKIQTITDEVMSLLNDASGIVQPEVCYSYLKDGLDLCDSHAAELWENEALFLCQHDLFIKHVWFSINKLLIFETDIASLRNAHEEMSKLIESVKLLKFKYEKVFGSLVSQSSSTNFIAKPLLSPADMLRLITNKSFQLLNAEKVTVDEIGDLEGAFERFASSQVHIELDSSEMDIKPIYELVRAKPVVKDVETDNVAIEVGNKTPEMLMQKNEEITNLKLNIALLEKNMKLFTKQTSDRIQQLENQVRSLKTEVEAKTTKIATLEEENKLFRNQSLLQEADFNDIESQRAYNEKIKRMEKLIELKQRATSSHDIDDLTWLAFPKRSKVWKKPTQLQTLSQEIRNLATNAQYVHLNGTNKQHWAPRKTTAKFINACMNEQFRRYQSKKEEAH